MLARRAPGLIQQAKQALTEGLHQQKLVEMLYPQELRLDARFDKVVVQYHQARTKFEQLRQECQQLRAKLETQRQSSAIARRLTLHKQEEAPGHQRPAYSHTVTPELHYGIQATWSAFAQLRQL